MASPSDISWPHNGDGGFYELDVVLGPRSDDRLRRGLESLWRHAEVDGCFRRLPPPPEAVPLSLESLVEHGQLHGVLQLPWGPRVVCGALALRYDDGTDELVLFLPLGALSEADPRVGAFPFGKDGGVDSLTWRRPLDAWLAEVARRVHEELPFQHALIGFEPEAAERTRALSDARDIGCVIPDGQGSVRYVEANR